MKNTLFLNPFLRDIVTEKDNIIINTHFMKLKHLILFAVLFICSCDILFDEPESKPKPDTKGLLIGAKVLSYFNLPKNVREKATDGYAFHRSYTKSDFLKKEDGCYVRMIVNNIKLAHASTQDTNYLALLDTSSLYLLYGKYRNHPEFYGYTGNVIKGFQRNYNHNLFYIARNKDIDTAYYGPLREIPAKMLLYCSALDSATFPTISLR